MSNFPPPGRRNNDPPQMSTSYFLQPVTMLPYVAKEALQM